jgi:hypothetical protein
MHALVFEAALISLAKRLKRISLAGSCLMARSLLKEQAGKRFCKKLMINRDLA